MPTHGAIHSTANQHVRYARSLHKRRARYREKRYLIEGHRLVAQALQGGSGLAFVFHTAEFARSEAGAALVAQLAASDAAMWSVSDEVLGHLADTETPQGIVAVAIMPEPNESAVIDASPVVILDNLRDPGNLGTILRTCQATSVEAVLLSVGCVDPYSPKVVRGGMGAHLAVAILPSLSWEDIQRLTRGKRAVLADANGEYTPWQVDWTGPSGLIVGSEAHGAGPQARALAELTVRLPMAGETESLNAAIAAAVLLYEAYRQRHPD